MTVKTLRKLLRQKRGYKQSDSLTARLTGFTADKALQEFETALCAAFDPVLTLPKIKEALKTRRQDPANRHETNIESIMAILMTYGIELKTVSRNTYKDTMASLIVASGNLFLSGCTPTLRNQWRKPLADAFEAVREDPRNIPDAKRLLMTFWEGLDRTARLA